MADGFELASAFVTVTTKDETQEGENRILSRLGRMRATAQVDADTSQAEARVGRLASKPIDIKGDVEIKGDPEGQGQKWGARFGKAAAVGIGAAAAGAGVLLSKAVANSLDMSAAQQKLTAQLGDPAMAQRAGQVAGSLYAHAYGESLGEVNDAVRTVIQSGAVMRGATNEQIQDITGKVLSLSTAFGQDLGGATNAVAQMMRTGLAPDAQSALDILTVGFQQGNDKAGDLLDTFNEYGTQFRKVGLDGADAMGLISQGLQGGARDADLVADAIKEFSIRAIDGSKTTVQGFTMLGLSADDMRKKIAAGGPAAKEALGVVLDRLRAVKDPADKATIAFDLFGTQSEDLGGALEAMDLDTAAQGIGTVDGAASKLNDTLGDTAQSKIEAVKRGFEQWTTSLVETKGPLGDVAAGVMAFGPDAIGVLAPLGSMLAALKMQGAVGALTAVKTQVAAVGTSASVAAGAGGVGRLKGALSGIGGVVALGAIALAMDKINESSEGGNLAGWNGELHDLVRIGTGDWGNPLEDIAAQMDATARNIQSGDSAVGKMFGWINQQIHAVSFTPIEFTADTGPAKAQADTLIDEVNRSVGTVNINGNDNPAGFALREVLAEIDAGKATVMIDGQSIPAQDALHYVEGLISNGAGTVTINGRNIPAGQALADILGRTNRSSASISVGANTGAAQGVINSFIQRNDGRRISIYTSVLGSGGIASAGRLATGGPVQGPGTGTSDSAGLFALSNGEHVFTAREVHNAGGHAAVERLRAELDRGPVRRLASGGAAMRDDRGARSSGPDRAAFGPVTVNVTQVSSSPMETGRFVALALRSV